MNQKAPVTLWLQAAKPLDAAPSRKTPVGPIDAFWHLLNFIAPAVCMGVVTATLAKLIWRRELQMVSWRQLSIWAICSSLLVLVAGLALFGHDGRSATYGAMIVACSLSLWWIGFVRTR